jgi:hypothetical protein
LTTHFLIVLRLRTSGALSPLLHTPSWHAHRQLQPSLNVPRVILWRTGLLLNYAFKRQTSGFCQRVESSVNIDVSEGHAAYIFRVTGLYPGRRLNNHRYSPTNLHGSLAHKNDIWWILCAKVSEIIQVHTVSALCHTFDVMS